MEETCADKKLKAAVQDDVLFRRFDSTLFPEIKRSLFLVLI